MKYLILSAAFASLMAISACVDISPDAASPEAAKAASERIETAVAADLSEMDIPEIIDFVADESTDMTDLLKTVTDGASAQAAVDEIRRTIPRLNAAIRSLENLDIENVNLNFGNVRKLMKVGQSQTGLVNEVIRISQIPEAREILEKEFDKIEITSN